MSDRFSIAFISEAAYKEYLSFKKAMYSEAPERDLIAERTRRDGPSGSSRALPATI